MIFSPTGRFLVVALDETTLLFHDRRWRRTRRIAPTNGKPFAYREGRSHALLTTVDENSVTAAVHSAEDPRVPLATGQFVNGTWTFTGDAQAWSQVEEYLVLPGQTPSLLRIADHAKPLPLPEVPGAVEAHGIPGSRLMVLAGGGSVAVIDPATSHIGVKFVLENSNERPTFRFRDSGKEMWLDDVQTLLKIETANWSVLDAAGSTEEAASKAGQIRSWAFDSGADRVVVVRDGFPGALILNAATLDLLGTTLEGQELSEAAIWDDRTIGVTPQGKVVTSRGYRTLRNDAST